MELVAILIAGIAGFAVGAAWYMTLAGRWSAALEQRAAVAGSRPPTAGMVLSIVGNLVMSAVLAWFILHATSGVITVAAGVTTGFLAWLGFVITTLSVNYAFGQRKPELTAIDGGYWLAALLVEGAILGAML